MVALHSGILREDGGYSFKKGIVDAIIHIITTIPAAREVGTCSVGVDGNGF